MQTIWDFVTGDLLEIASRFYWVGILSLIIFLGTLVAIPMIIVRLPTDYFSVTNHHLFLPHLPKSVRYLVLVIKNVLGVLFLLAGICMLFLPGQGILTILIGISMMNFPGKRKLEVRIFSRPAVHKGTTWLRHKAGKEPLELPPGYIPPVPG